MFMNKRGTELSMSTIITIVLALLVLLVILFIFWDSIGAFFLIIKEQIRNSVNLFGDVNPK